MKIHSDIFLPLQKSVASVNPRVVLWSNTKGLPSIISISEVPTGGSIISFTLEISSNGEVPAVSWFAPVMKDISLNFFNYLLQGV